MSKTFRSKESENLIIGMIIKRNDVYFDLTSQGLTSGHFFDVANKKIFEAIAYLADNNQKISVKTISSILPESEMAIANYKNQAPIAENPEYYLGLLKKQFDSMNVLECLSDISSKLNNDKFDFNIIEYASAKIDELTKKSDISRPEFIREFGEGTLKDLEESIKNSESDVDRILRTPITSVNEKFTMLGGDLVVIGARPGMGKTAFALNIAEHVAKQNKTVLFFTLEMPKKQIHQRLIALDSRISVNVMRTGKMSDNAFKTFAKSTKNTLDLKIAVDDEAGQTFEKIKSKIKLFNRRHKADLVIIDYLTLMKSAKTYFSTRDMVNDFTMSLKALAINLDIPIILLCQLNRDTSKRSNPLPILTDLKESGSIEQDADAVLFLYHENDQSEQRQLQDDESIVLIAKNRHGDCGKTVVGWDKPSGKFFNKD